MINLLGLHFKSDRSTVGRTYTLDLSQKVREQRGGTVVAVGHSDTTRDVLRQFGYAEAKDIPNSEYDNLYIATFGPLT